MAKRTRKELKPKFKNGEKPNEDDFEDLIDSFWSKEDDKKIDLKSAGPGTETILLDGSTGEIQASNIKTGKVIAANGVEVTGGAIIPKVGNDHTDGISFPHNPYGGSGDEAYIRYYKHADTEDTVLEIANKDNPADHIVLTTAGNVGIATSPTPQYKLHVNGSFKSNEGVINGITIGSHGMGFKYDYEYETIGVSQNNFNLRLQAPNEIYFHTGHDGGQPKVSMAIEKKGNVHVNGSFKSEGDVKISGGLEVRGEITIPTDLQEKYKKDTVYGFLNERKQSHLHQYLTQNTTTVELPVGYSNISDGSKFSIIAQKRILAEEFDAASDVRIKNRVSLSNKIKDTEILEKLLVKDYHYIDMVNHGFGSKKGFIAQDVEKIFPEAVCKVTRVIPNIYQKAKDIIHDPNEETLTITVDDVDGLEIGDEVQLISKSEYLVEVCAISGTTFTVKGWMEKDTEEVFVYGKQVDDFRVLDYDRIFTLNVSATQVLANEVDKLNQQLADLQNENASLKKSFDKLQEQMAELARSITATKTNGQVKE